ncbi:retrovirus-related pol polyprotein from transposon TNT 1-94 [Tanacetum coccineum]
MDLLVQQYEQFTILEEESIDSGFARFNTIITSLKALDEGFSSKNYVRKFLRALHPKWRVKVTATKESKDLSSLALDELIGNLKVHEVVLEKDSEIYRGKKERVKSISLKAKKESSDDETLTFGSDDEEYAMAVRNFKKFFRRKGKFIGQPREENKSFRQRDKKKGKSDRKCFRCDDPNHLIGDCPKLPRNKDQKAFIGGSWSDSENNAKDKTNDETCLMAQSSNEVCLRTCLEPDEWIKDSGFSKHMTGNKSLFSTYKAYDGGNVVFGSNLKGKIIDKAYCDAQGITHNFSAPRTPQSNGVVERKNRTLQEISRIMLNEQSIPQKFWCNAVDTSTYILNRILIRPILGKTPYEIFRGRKPLEYFKVFGSKCFILNTKDYLTNFDPKSYEGIFLGYSQNSKAYVVLNKHTMKVEESLNVTFDESPPPTKLSPLVDNDVREEEAIKKNTKVVNNNNEEDKSIEVDEIVNIKESKNHPLDQVIGNLNQRTLRSLAQNHSNFFCFISMIETKDVKEALKDESWVIAMQEELNQFLDNDVWELVPLPMSQSVIETKWVFRN